MAKSNIPQVLLDAYAGYIIEDYRNWGRLGRLAEANFQVSFEVGSSYIKVVKQSYNQTSVHSFIVNKDGKFPKGTILKSASWKAPATNFARGQIANPDSWVGHVSWTGAH
jgi:hypothetical protein